MVLAFQDFEWNLELPQNQFHTRSGPALPSVGPQSQGPLRGPPDCYISLFDVPTFSASFRMCGPQSKAKGGVLFTKYLASIQHFNTLESLDLFFSTIEQLLGLKLIVSEAIIAQS